MTTNNKKAGTTVLFAALIAFANIAQAEEPANTQDLTIEGFEARCLKSFQAKYCAEQADLAQRIAALEAARAQAANQPKRPARTGPRPTPRLDAIERRLYKLEHPDPAQPESGYGQLRSDVDQLQNDLASLTAEVRKDDRDHDGNVQELLAQDKRDAERFAAIERRLEKLGAQARPIEFSLYAGALLLTAMPLDGSIDVSYATLTPQLLIPIWGDTSLELEASLLLGNDDKNPFGTFSRVGVAYRAGERVQLVGGIGLLMASIDDHLDAELAAVLGTAGVRFGIGHVRFLDFGFDIMLGNALNADHDQGPMSGIRGMVGGRLPD